MLPFLLIFNHPHFRREYAVNWKEFIDVKLEEWLLIISTIVIVLLVFLQVLARYVFDMSVGWSAELSRYLLIWITWVSTSYAIRKREHIRISVVVERLSVPIQKVIEIIVIFLWGIFATVMAIVGTQIVMNIQLMGQKTSTLGLPMWVIYVIIPLGGILMLLRLIQQLFFVITDRTEFTQKHGGDPHDDVDSIW